MRYANKADRERTLKHFQIYVVFLLHQKTGRFFLSTEIDVCKQNARMRAKRKRKKIVIFGHDRQQQQQRRRRRRQQQKISFSSFVLHCRLEGSHQVCFYATDEKRDAIKNEWSAMHLRPILNSNPIHTHTPVRLCAERTYNLS